MVAGGKCCCAALRCCDVLCRSRWAPKCCAIRTNSACRNLASPHCSLPHSPAVFKRQLQRRVELEDLKREVQVCVSKAFNRLG